MITYRLRGLVNLHIACVTVLGCAYFLAMAGIVMSQRRFLDLSEELDLSPYVLCVALGLVMTVRYTQQLSARFHKMSWVDAAQLSTRQSLMVALCVFSFMFAFKDRDMSRLFLGTYLCSNWVLLFYFNRNLPRFLSGLLFPQQRRLPTLLVGRSSSLKRIKSWMRSKEMIGLHAVGYLSVENESEGEAETRPPCLGQIEDLAQMIESTSAVQVILLETPRTVEQASEIIKICQQKGSRLLIYSTLADVVRHPMTMLVEQGHLFYTLQEEPLEDPVNRLLKRLLDLAISIPVVLFLLLPLTVVVWLVQSLQAPGPVFFTQHRTGYGGRTFKMLKFRSMFHQRKRDEAMEANQAKKGDSRIYPFGRFIRRTSLDEFPQFLNVLLGQMSVVGPRPHMQAHDRLFEEMMQTYRTRFLAKPGITGLAQCNGLRGEITDAEKLQMRIDYDVEYITEWSFWLDLQIIVRTAIAVIRPPKTAY